MSSLYCSSSLDEEKVGNSRFFPFLCKLVGEFLNVNSGYNIMSLKITNQNEAIYFHFYI